MNTSKYFFQTIVVIVVSTVAFLFFKSILPKKLFSESIPVSKNIVVDSLMLDAIEAHKNDSVKDNSKDDSIIKKEISFQVQDGIKFPSENFDVYKGNQYLIPLFKKLHALETKKEGKVRIAYYGDSMTDGDLIVKDFRTFLQEKFGGEGVGFVNITSESASSRSSITHEYSKNWKTQSYLKVKKPAKPFGVNGHVFYANDTTNLAWVKYKANATRFANHLNKPTLFYGKASNKEGIIQYIAGTDTISKKLVPNNLLNTTVLSEASLKTLQVNFKKADSIPIYGFNFDNGIGIHVDNFSNRGNSGLPIGSFDIPTMRAFHAKLEYDLIILQYGANVLNYGTLDYSWYERRMEKVVNHLHKCFPGVAILIVSTADKSTKYDMEMKTDSAVVPLNTSQKRYAIKTKSSFVNLYTLMGGEGSMVQWVEEIPSRANKDYTHFNHRGAKEAANLVASQLLEGYEQYKKLLLKRKKVPKSIKKDSIFSTKDSVNEK